MPPTCPSVSHFVAQRVGARGPQPTLPSATPTPRLQSLAECLHGAEHRRRHEVLHPGRPLERLQYTRHGVGHADDHPAAVASERLEAGRAGVREAAERPPRQPVRRIDRVRRLPFDEAPHAWVAKGSDAGVGGGWLEHPKEVAGGSEAWAQGGATQGCRAAQSHQARLGRHRRRARGLSRAALPRSALRPCCGADDAHEAGDERGQLELPFAPSFAQDAHPPERRPG